MVQVRENKKTMKQFSTIHIFEGSDVRYLGVGTEDKKEKTSFSVRYDQITTALLDNFVNEVISLLPPKV